MKITKNVLSILLSVIMVLGVYAVAPITASAEFYTADGIKWCYEVLEDGRSVRIVYGSEPADPNAGSISGPITIPRSFYLDDGKVYTVTEIDNAFNSTVAYGSITSVTIPDTVKTIGRLSFNKLSNLSSVIINGNSLETIGASAFYGCKNLSSITIPQGVKTIDNYAFYNCESLSSVVIPDNVTTFGTYVFRNCTNLQSAVIGANVTSLNGTFINCGNLESVTFSSNSVTDFSSYTFYGCGSLTSITIPCDFDKNKFEPGSASYINIPETDLNDNPDDDVHTFTVQGTSASGTFFYTHNYGEPVWNWDDVSHPTYSMSCEGCGDEKTGKADRVTFTHTNPDGVSSGATEAKASVVIDGETYESTHAVDAFEISDYAGLKAFAARVNNGETNLIAVLVADIDASASAQANDWTPIGDGSGPDDSQIKYTGTFDGLGHKITGLTVNNPQQNYAGLFGCVGEGGKVMNVGLEGGSITGAYNVGGVAGRNYGTIGNCYNTGDVSGYNFVGGVVGDNEKGTVTSCYNTGAISGNSYVGGVVGENTSSTISNCYNTGSVTATGQYADAGGVVGNNYYNSSVENCYNTGSVTATGQYAYVGGVAGDNYLENSSVKNCCYDSDRAPGIPAIGYEISATHTNVEGLTTAQMTGESALDNMVFEYEAGEENPWLTKANTDDISFYPHLKGFAYDSEPTAENWPPKFVLYPLWVGGNQVTTGNMDDVLEDGTVRFEAVDGKHILTLENADITESYRYEEFDDAYTTANIVTAYPVNDTELTIVLIGGNKLSVAEYGIRDSNSRLLTITGDGSLDVTADKTAIQGVDLFIDGADITAKGTGGADGVGSGIITDNLTIRNSAISATGSELGNGIYGTSTEIIDSVITAESEMNVAVVSSTLSVSGNSTVIAECASDEDSAIIAAEFVFDDRNDITEPCNYRLENNGDYKLVYNADDNTAAKKVVIGKGYAVTFLDGDGETVLYKTKVLEGANPEYKGETPTRTDPSGGYTYAFSGWKDGNNNEYAPGATFPAAEGDITYTAQFTETPVEYTVTFFVDGEQYSQSTVPFGNGITKPDNPQKEYYDFTGWDAEIPETMPAQNLEFNAVFKAIEYTATFIADGETIKEVKFTVEDDSIDEPAVPEKEGYEGKWSAYTLAAADITIPAEYTAIEYTATFVDENGSTVAEVKYTIDTKTIKDKEPAVPEKANYTGKWEEYTLAIGGVTIKPVYTINNVDVTVESDGKDDGPIGYKEEKTFTASADNLPEGTEIHWFVNGEDVGTGESYTVEDPTDDYTVQAKVIDKDGNTIAESEEQTVKVRNGFMDKLKWFFSDFWNNIFKAVIDAIIKAC